MSDLMDGTHWVGDWLEADPVAQKAREARNDPRFADPINRLYRIETVEDVKRSWAYINMTRNKSQYTEDAYTRVYNRIVKAWQKLIDRNGPPSTR